jgi:predicted dehydrogenase
MAEGDLRAALLGAGMISLYHLRAWEAVSGARIVAVCDTDRVKAEERAREFGIERVYDDPERLFADGGFELVDIAASVEAHDPMTRMAANHGVHVMLQKPMTRTVTEAEALVRDVGERIRFMVHENYRFRPHYLMVQEWIAEGRIGTPRHAAMAVAQGLSHSTARFRSWLSASHI